MIRNSYYRFLLTWGAKASVANPEPGAADFLAAGFSVEGGPGLSALFHLVEFEYGDCSSFSIQQLCG